MLSPEDLDETNQPLNPKLNETVHQFLMRQKELVRQPEYPPGTVFECVRCGDCCRYNFYHLSLTDTALLDKLYMLSKYPHGYWVLLDNRMLTLYMPLWLDPKNPVISFSGPVPEEHIDFMMRTVRRHGYWVLSEEGLIVVYNPTPCIHFIDKGQDLASCDIYEDRPEICKAYSCRRYPVYPRQMKK